MRNMDEYLRTAGSPLYSCPFQIAAVTVVYARKKYSSGCTPKSCSFTVHCPDGLQLLLRSFVFCWVKKARAKHGQSRFYSRALLQNKKAPSWKKALSWAWFCSAVPLLQMPKVQKNMSTDTYWKLTWMYKQVEMEVRVISQSIKCVYKNEITSVIQPC